MNRLTRYPVPYADKYYLYDKFITAKSAGSVNNTYAEPVGGARTVTDTNSKLSIAGGVATFATGGSAEGNPGMWYSGLTRASGLCLLVSATLTSSGEWGWDGNTLGGITHRFYMGTSTIYVTTTTVLVGVFTNGVNYQYAVILRSSGAFYLVKGGAFTNWTLLWVEAATTITPIYPGIGCINTTSVFTADNIRVPKKLYIPVPLQSDGFSASTTDGKGNAEQNGPVGNSWTGATWSVAAGSVSNTPVTLGSERITNGTFNTDISGWTDASDAGSSIAWDGVGKMNIISDGTNARAQQQTTTVANTWYKVSFDTSSNLVLTVGTSAAGGQLVASSTVNGTGVPVTFMATTTASHFQYRLAAASTRTLDNVTSKALTTSELFRSITCSSANVLADVAITRTALTHSGLVLNLDSAATPANFVIAYLDGQGNAKLDKCVAGTYTNVISAAVTYSAGAVLRVIKDGTSYMLFYNDLAVGTVKTISDAGITSNTLHGLFSTYSGNTLDNFVVWARGNSETQYTGLDVL